MTTFKHYLQTCCIIDTLKLNPDLVSFSLVYLIQVLTLFTRTVRRSADLENLVIFLH